ncbi:c-type cytochrome [Variovorax sp. YR216]|uniref:c-type cytochrome n=1 Tax=Variovorax sp. YR216 TaxID=1882828 RepID=UPI0008948F8B|nr:c-type cytochrome [Variovorax sp. YR216]SEB19447.1 Cytochrome c [Variovorax sp. YR216]
MEEDAPDPASIASPGLPAQKAGLRLATRDALVVSAFSAAISLGACGGGSGNSAAEQAAIQVASAQQAAAHDALVAEGKQVFRYETFGDEAQWSDALKMHEVIGSAVDPTTALSVGLKVDADALPAAVVRGIQDGSIDLKSPDTTVALLKLDAVVGLKGKVQSIDGKDVLTRVGITCALCHSTVDNSFAPGIGRRLDGWANRDLNPGAIIALSPSLDATMKAVFNSWGKGKFDPRHNIDGISNPVVIPPAFGLQDVHSVTFTGDGNEPAYWNRYVAVAEMGGQGSFTEPRLNLHITNGTQDLVTNKLPALQAYELSLKAPAPPPGSFDSVAAMRGKAVFEGAGRCASCHSGALFTDANTMLHPPSDSIAEPESPSYAARSATRLYRTTPLKGVWQHSPYFHNGSAATLEDVASTYNTKRSLGLTPQDIADLAQYLKSL